MQKDIRVSEERSVFLPSLRRRPSFISRSTSRRACLCVCSGGGGGDNEVPDM